MVKVNGNFQKLPGSYLFSEIARRVSAYEKENSGIRLIRMGIGDVTRPLARSVIEAMESAVQEMGTYEGFRGYGPEKGYDFLRKAIAQNDYAARGIGINEEEIFISDGAKSDCGNIGDIFDTQNVVAVCDPVYPVYIDTNAMAGRAGEYQPDKGTWDRLVYLECNEENGFVPMPDSRRMDMIYLCFPNNPTGAVATHEQLKKWVEYALENDSVILYDSAYEAYITDDTLPHSIYEIPGAEKCAIEFRSFSKTAGFTGNRCAYTVVPDMLVREGVKLKDLWDRRQSTKFNGVPYVVQRGAEAVYSEQGKREVRETVDYYMNNAAAIYKGLAEAGLKVFGGKNSPYIWAATPDDMSSWEFFDFLLEKAHVVTTPGAGFGPSGEGYIRLTAFGGHEDTLEAIDRIAEALR